MHLIIKYSIFILFLATLQSCGIYKPTDAREFPPEPEKRVAKNIEEGRGFQLFKDEKTGGVFDFATSNELWRASLDTIDFMPLASVNYSGGIIITDWYSNNQNPNESIKISIRFLTNEIRSDALDIDIFIKECSQNSFNCSIDKKNNALVAELSLNILKKAAVYEKEIIKQKKSNPYKFSKPKRKNKKKKTE